VHNNKN